LAKKAVKTSLKKTAPKASKKTSKKVAARATKKVTKKSSKKSPAASAVKSATKSSKKASPSPSAAGSLLGAKAPVVAVPTTAGGIASLADFKGKNVVLYFYPKDNTPGCTLEGYDFKRLAREFDAAETVILGVSKDSLKTHQNFKQKCGFPFDLLVDDEEKLCRAFDVIQMKSLYGRQYLGIERSTFVINRDGRIAQEWRKVKVNGHAEEVLDFVRTI
jgi:thioredoxin-dependent peroxiredoxin